MSCSALSGYNVESYLSPVLLENGTGYDLSESVSLLLKMDMDQKPMPEVTAPLVTLKKE